MIQRLQQKRNEDGFTLIELLIVIIVLGILAAIVVFAIGSTRKDSVASSCKTNVKAVELSAEAVYTKTGVYPGGPINADNAAAIVAPSNGALLKSFPTSSDYILQYNVSGVAPNQIASVSVFRGTHHLGAAGVVEVSDTDNTPATALVTGSVGCEAL